MTTNKTEPDHYKRKRGGVEAIDVTETFNFNLGNAVKYIWRAGNKEGESEEDDLRKALWYVLRELDRVVWENASEDWSGDRHAT